MERRKASSFHLLIKQSCGWLCQCRISCKLKSLSLVHFHSGTTIDSTHIYTLDSSHTEGSPLSSILHLSYNADLLEVCAGEKVDTSGHIDDVSLLATGPTPQHNTHALKIANREAQKWAQKHGSVFAPSKYTLTHFAGNMALECCMC